jgi:hypothetical protein
MKPNLRILIPLPVIALIIIGAGGCSSSATSPTAPSAATRGATIQGTLQAAAAASSDELTAFSSAGGIKVTVVGTNLSTTTDGSGRFVLEGVAGGSATLRFQGQGIDGTIELGGLVEGQTLTITVRVSGSRPQLVSPSSPASPSPSPSGNKVELDGNVESVTPPSLKVAGRTVVTNADTKIKRGDQTITLGDVNVGDRVEVEGISQSDGSVLASKITVENDENGDQNQNDEQVDFSGHVDSISAPILVVSGRKVVTNGSTRIRRGDKTVTLGDLKIGDKVEVQGTGQADGSVLASKIKVEDGGDDENDDGEDS